MALLGVPAPSRAAAPDHRWRTLESPHFEVTFHEGLYPLALKAARSLEHAHGRLVPLLGAEPDRKTQVLLADDTDAANGSATAQGRPQIWLLAEPPDDLSVLGDYDDYVYLLVAHEYVHVLHLGTVKGLPSWLNWILGDVWIPNGMQPRFATEGLATYQESHLSSGGRMRSAIFDMYLRADVLEDRLLSLGQLSGGPNRWPWGTAWYLYGGKLMEYLALTRGDEAILRYSHAYASNLIPHSMNVDLADAAGVDWLSLYDEWQASLRERYRLQLEAIRARGPITEPKLRTSWGETTGSPRWSPDGRRLFYVENSPDRRPWLRALDRETGEDAEIHDLGATGDIAPLPDGDAVVLARAEVLHAYRAFGDLFRVDEEGERRLTTGERASEVDVSRDGSFAVFVRRERGGTTLMRLPLRERGAEAEVLYRPPEGRQLYTPRIAPDGKTVAFALTRPAHGRDLALLSIDTGALRLLTDDGASDIDPAWTPDGSALLFSSDRTGVFNLYRISASGGGPITRLTNVSTGAFQPTLSADGTWLAWTTYGSRGFDVAATPIASLHPAPAEPFDDDRPAPGVRGDDAIYPVRPYDPLETVAPTSWFPYLAADGGGTVVGATVTGADMVGRHGWGLSAGYGLGSHQPQAAASYSYGGWFPTLTVGGSTFARSVPGFATGTTERVSSGNVALTFPWASTRRAQSFTVGYGATWLEPLVVDPADAPEAGLAAELQAGWSFSSAERPADAISMEDGVGIQLGTRFGSPSVGGDFSYAAVDASASVFLRLPWARHHVLALSGRGGIGSGDLGRRRLFSLGGPLLRDPLLDLLYTGQYLGTAVLRGYEPGAFVGSNLLLGTAEYRFPILNVDEGAWTLPIYAGRLSGAIFGEAGDAFDLLLIRRLHPSAGGELRLDVAVGNLLGAVRLGYAYGFDVDQGGGHRAYLGVGAGF